MTRELAGRRIIVVGGASGIGLATVRLFASAGAGVAVLDRDPAAQYQADVQDTDAVGHAVAAAAAGIGGLDGIVYCAGIDLISPLAETRDADWNQVLDVNLTGAMRVCRAALRHFAPEGGTIVLVSSAAGLRPLPERTAYCAAKAGLVMLAKTLAAELAPRGIRVNALCPGAVETPLFRSSLPDTDLDPALERIRERYALHRIAEPEEMARAILFLTSEASSYVTGTALAADGARSFH